MPSGICFDIASWQFINYAQIIAPFLVQFAEILFDLINKTHRFRLYIQKTCRKGYTMEKEMTKTDVERFIKWMLDQLDTGPDPKLEERIYKRVFVKDKVNKKDE